jgi:DNA polymerase elongation subunit (family B)
MDKVYTPYFYAVNLPKRYYKDVKDSTIEESEQLKPYIGYCENEENVIKIRTHARSMMTWVDIFETKTPIERQWCEESKIFPSSWFDEDTMLKVNQDVVPNLLLCSFDIECYSSTGLFPSASNPNDCVTMICMSFQRMHGGDINSVVLSLDAESYSVHNEIVEQCSSEEVMFQRFAEIIREYNPDVLMGYNIDIFDARYIHDRLVDTKTLFKSFKR